MSDQQDSVSHGELSVDQSRQNVNLEGQRAARADRLKSDTEDKAVKLAVKQALRDQHVDTVLLSHTQRLDQIGNTVDRIKDSLYTTDKKMDTFIAVGDAVAHKSISTRTFVLGVLAIGVPIVGYILSTVHA